MKISCIEDWRLQRLSKRYRCSLVIPRKIIKLNKYKNNTYLVINIDKIFITILSFHFFYSIFYYFQVAFPTEV